MSYQASYRTYRPTDFSEMVGQKHILRTLNNAVAQNKIAHAYLFTGPRGTGKTTVARILAKAVNCTGDKSETIPCNQCANCLTIQKGTHPDIIEIDAASNNGVDEVRDLIEKVKYAPNFGRFKVYIIDEVHMMSTGAFNALLKTLEEPPSHVLFVLATTEPHKILPTIVSRCQRYDFTRISNADIESIIRMVIEKEHVQCDEASIRLIGTLADGGMRDALSILDQCIAYAGNDIDISTINEIYGITTIEENIKLFQAMEEKDAKQLLDQLHRFLNQGVDVKRLCSNLVEILKESIIYQLTKSDDLLVLLKKEEAVLLTGLFTTTKIFFMIETLMESQEKFKFASNITSYFELALLKMMAEEPRQVQTGPSEHAVSKQTVHRETGKETKQTTTSPSPRVSKTTEQQVKAIAVDDVINLMVQGSVDDRRQTEEQWRKLSDYFLEDKYRRVAKWLFDGKIVASNGPFVLFATNYQMQADMINDPAQLETIVDLMDAIFQRPRKVFAISEPGRVEAIQRFLLLRDQNALPVPVEISLPKREKKVEVKKDDVEERLQEICGNLLEIIED